MGKSKTRAVNHLPGLIGLFLALMTPFCIGQSLPASKEKVIGIVDAGQWTLERNLNLEIQREQVNLNAGALLSQRGAFDTNLNASVSRARKYTPQLPDIAVLTGQNWIISNSVTSELSASMLTPSGVTVTPSIQVSRNTDNYTQLLPVNQAQIGVEVVIPLGRNGGLDASLKEDSAALEEQASRFDLMSLTSQLLASTASAYWQLVGSTKVLAAQIDAEQRARAMLDSVQALAKVDVIPRIQVQDALAFLATRSSARIGQEKTVVQAQQQLGLAIGLDRNDLLGAIKTKDELPAGNGGVLGFSDINRLRPLVDAALIRRGDYLAAMARVEKQRALVAASRNALKPQIDFTGNAAYTGVTQGTSVSNHLAPILSSSTGPALTFGIRYQFPIQNRTAQGAFAQNQAALTQQQLRLEATARQVSSDIVNASSALDISVLQLREAKIASDAARAAMGGASERLRNGVGSVLDSLQVEDRYISALINEITVQVTYAIAIANFRLATGTYLDPDLSSQTVSAQVFYSPTRQSAEGLK